MFKFLNKLRKYLNLVILVLILLIGSLNLLNIFTKKLDNKQIKIIIKMIKNICYRATKSETIPGPITKKNRNTNHIYTLELFFVKFVHELVVHEI